jgi:hypothetical protein
MTTTTIHSIRDERLVGSPAVLITVGALALANFARNGNGWVGPYAVSVGVCAILAAVLFGRHGWRGILMAWLAHD